MIKLLLLPISWLYGAVVMFRHKLFDWGFIKSKEYDIPVLCVGNITVGGTGKTPVCEMLISNLSSKYNIAVVSRGYKRISKGYMEVKTTSPYRQVGDEPKQIKRKFPKVLVCVCEKRAEAIDRIKKEHPEINLILLDDGFQHRYVEAWTNVILMDYSRPIFHDTFLPYGSLRDSKKELHRANVIIITKCPENLNALDKRIMRKHLNLFPYQSLFFAIIKHLPPVPIFNIEQQNKLVSGANIIAVSGIANPLNFTKSLENTYNICGSLAFSDHHAYTMRDLKKMIHLLNNSPKGTLIVTTEKDAIKLTNAKKIPAQLQQSLYYVPMRVEIMDERKNEFLEKLEKHVNSNQKYGLLH